jgi:cytochrome c oxidase cbb3-type subunit 2
MSLRTFIIGVATTFGVAWLAVIVVPYLKMRDLQPVLMSGEPGAALFHPKRTGRVADGAEIYAENGCYLCHTQVVRPVYAGNDLYRPDWGGLQADESRGDTRRETNPFDFQGETFAQIGVNRIGPDLSNLGRRMDVLQAAGTDPKRWLFARLYNPRLDPTLYNSTCPPHPFLFEKRRVHGAGSPDALVLDAGKGYELVPRPAALALVSYLLSMKKDHPAPAAFDFAPAKDDSEN